jgi:hypothetical protein
MFPFLFAVKELYSTRYQRGSFSLFNVGSGFHCLRSFSFFFFSAQTESLTVVACVILQCIPCFMSADACLMECFQFVSFLTLLMVIQIRVCQRFVRIIFVDSPHSSNNDIGSGEQLLIHD